MDQLKCLEAAEKESNLLKTKVASLRRLLRAGDDRLNVENLESINRKMKYRIGILKQAIKDCQASTGNCNITGLSIQQALILLFEKALIYNYPDVSKSLVSVNPTEEKFGDYQCNMAMSISQVLKSKGIKTNPREIAEKLTSNLPENSLIKSTQIAGPGFINIRIKEEFVADRITNIFLHGLKPPVCEKKLRVIVDYSSPNIAKEMHVGHLRSTIIGDAIANLLEYLGHDVLRINHIGDWGTQFGMLIAHLKDVYPNYLTESPTVENLQRYYKESKIRFDTDEEFKKEAYDCVVKLQAKSPDHLKAWGLICDASRKEFGKIYERLGVKLTERGESFYQSLMEDLLLELQQKELLETDEGRKVMWGNGTKIPLTIEKSGGGYTYDTSDLAAMKHRIQEEKADWLIYVIDEGQATHIEIVKSCAERAGYLDSRKVRVDFVGFGVVLGDDKRKFKTRSGDTVKLSELLNEGVKRASDKLKEKERDKILTEEELKEAENAIAYGCIKYADLAHNRNHAYIFSFDKMLEDKGNTAVYLLYAYTRIKSISRNSEITYEMIKKDVTESGFTLQHEKEIKLAKVLLQFGDILMKVTKDLYPHRICEYLYDVACVFSEFYDNCYCIEKNSNTGETKINMSRLLLCEVTAIVMKKAFDIIGINTVSRM